MATTVSGSYARAHRAPARNWVRAVRRPSRGVAFLMVLVAYVLLTLGVIFRSPVLALDQYFVDLRLIKHYPGAWTDIHTYVILGQRKPSIEAFLPYFVWVGWRTRSVRPLVMLATALIMLNFSVGVAKLATGRLGPRGGHAVHDVFAGGDIYPSGHVSNAVVLYGLMAMIALRFRRTGAAVAVFISVSVALGTIYLNTHWFSDIVGGWLAGGLVLIGLPAVMSLVDRPLARASAWAGSRRERKYALTAIAGVLAVAGLTWVYFDINWDNLLGLLAVGVMVVACLPALVPIVLAWARRRRGSLATATSAEVPAEETIPEADPGSSQVRVEQTSV